MQIDIKLKKSLLIAFVLFCSYIGFAQNGFEVQSSGKGLYINHVVSAKENFYSIGRIYSISPKDIAAFNSLDMSSGLSVGQAVQIPLNNTNFTQTAQKGQPVYYVVGDKEGLYRVSVNNNKVSLDNLRKWNGLSGDAISTGQKLIVGYINADGTAAAPSNGVTAPKPEPAAPKAEPVAAKPEPAAASKQPEKEVVKSEPHIERPVEPAVQKPAPVTKPVTVSSTGASVSGAGYFKNQYDLQIKKFPVSKDETVTSGIFKTTSGWQDGKYYALMDGIEPGTIIRVTNPVNGKSIFAKVLGEMSGIRQNSGLSVRISNAAHSVLEVAETEKFIVKINY